MNLFRWSAGWGRWAVLLACWAAPAVHAQSQAEMQVLRRGIEVQRADTERTYNAEKAACYQQFVVNACLNQAKRKRSDLMAELKRQEVLLNDEDRRRRAADQVRKTDERTSAEAERSAAEQRARRVEDARRNQERMEDKGREQPKAAGTLEARQRDYKHKEAQRAQERHERENRVRDTAQETRDFNRKQQEAAEHREDVEKGRRQRTKPLSAPLPPTGAEPTPLMPQLLAPAPARPGN